MKLKLFNGTTFEAQVKEEKDSVIVSTNVPTLNELSLLYDQLTNFNLSKVIVTYTDGTHTEYKNLKTVESTWSKKANVISATITLTSKTEFEMKVDELQKEVKSDLSDLTHTQIALTEVYEMLLNM